MLDLDPHAGPGGIPAPTVPLGRTRDVVRRKPGGAVVLTLAQPDRSCALGLMVNDIPFRVRTEIVGQQ